MPDAALVRSLLGQPEGEVLDFKRTGYKVSDEASGLALVKDVVCMANTPREVAAHIVLGVNKHPDGRAELVGLDDHADEADLQAQFSNRVYPIPSFSYRPVAVDGKSIGLIEIPPAKQGPSLPVRDAGGSLRQWQVYFRRGSRSDVATGDDMARIFSWFCAAPAIRAALPDTADASWQQLAARLELFQSERRYLLILSPELACRPYTLTALGRIAWTAVFDFDPSSDQSGVLRDCRAVLEERSSLHLVTLRDQPSVNPRDGTYWFFPRGLAGREGTVELGPWRDWNRAYGTQVSDQLKRLARATSPDPVTCLALWYQPSLQRHLQTLVDAMAACFGHSLTLVIVSDDPAHLHSVAADVGAETFGMPLHQFCSGFASLAPEDPADGRASLAVPSSSGAPVTVPERDANWLAEELEVVGLGAGNVAPSARSVGRDFLRGAEITWYELGLHYDIERDAGERLQRQVESDLSRRHTSRINLYHAPGAGGTTLARRVLWNLHRRYPSCILARTTPFETAERLFRLASLAGLPVLLVVDGAHVAERQLDELYDFLKGRNTPVVLLQVLRRHTEQSQKERSFYLRAELSAPEALRFAHTFAREAPHFKRDIDALLAAPEPRMRSAFYFGLQAFRTDFLGLEPHVQQRLRSLTSTQEKLLGFLALAHHYAQRALPVQMFASLLSLPASRLLALDAALPADTLDLLVIESQGRCRTAHEVIAAEMLRQLLSPNTSDVRLWKQALSTWAIDFANLCADAGAVGSEELTEVARRTFIYRDNVEVLGTERSANRRFSRLLEDIPSLEGRLLVLQRLVEVFPDEPHFWAHLGRFYSTELEEHEKALECVERAIGLRDEDCVLHHMRGMALRQRAYRLIDAQASLAEVVSVAKESALSFSRARELNPDDEHGYIGEVQLLAKLLDYSGRSVAGGVPAYLESPKADPFVRDSFERAEELLERVRRHREGQGASPYEEDCRAKLDALYGRHERALQIWDGLLSRQGVYRPPVRRQIVWTYLARRERSWDGLSAREVDRAVALLEANLQEEPNSDTNLRLWVQAVRRSSQPPSVEAVIERVSYWRANADSLEASFYLYAFYVLAALRGSALASDNAARLIEECRARARFRRNRTKSFEWLGSGEGVGRLVHHSQLGAWLPDSEFWEDTSSLARVRGRISRLDAPQAGQIEMEGGLSAFFVPARGEYARGRSENVAVSFYLGFSYDGLRAWEVKDA